MEGIHVPFGDAPKLQRAQIVDPVKRMFDKHKHAEGVYTLGSAWITLDIIEEPEQFLYEK